MSSNLMCHAGARQVTLGDLEQIPTPPPTDTWFPVGHAQVVHMVMGQLERAGYGISKMNLAVTNDAHRFFGTLDLNSEVLDGVGLAVGIRNSLDKSFPIGFCAGARVFVCDNLAFAADIIVTSRHTLHGQDRYVEGIANAVFALHGFQIGERKRIERFQQTEISTDRANSLILQSYRREIVGARLLPRVCDAWEKPREDFQEPTLWRLLNAFTEAYKPRFGVRPNEATQETIRLQRFLETACEAQGEANGIPQLSTAG
jgi:hypothetical protein